MTTMAPSHTVNGLTALASVQCFPDGVGMQTVLPFCRDRVFSQGKPYATFTRGVFRGRMLFCQRDGSGGGVCPADIRSAKCLHQVHSKDKVSPKIF